MRRTYLRAMLVCASALGASIFIAEPAQAQATRTWVSGVGDDANPCSRTAPCKTFAGAISKTAAGGEINCLDPGGFGGVTIVKAMTISCLYTEGGVLVGGTSGITINAGATDVVYLRGLDIFGVSSPVHGVRFLAGGALHIEESTIRRFNSANSQGVLFAPSGAAALYISNTTISDNGNAGTGGGVLIQPTGAGGSARVTLSNVRANNNAGAGVRVETSNNTSLAGSVVTITDSEMIGNVQGLLVNTPASTTTATVTVTNSAINFNTSRGILAGGATALVRVGNTTITGNAAGLQSGTGAVINSYGDNRLDGNTPDGAFTLPLLPKK
ncbi:right-handed parallel beta-helix repeat-containing protein [Sphingomonas sp. LM7]|uniref:right-handed parallel beta-helix repeat-containing protein n=1 Tax=Sphingomonas sp. LM7 TaxID=1938607 RepID=UPI000983AAF1|nr:right-handed parallel beta-helix repeat-containing protein [Sphingomonas sp. LM7]AQR74784.1 hypothetical protein BXU08_14970 [Sphingomonas sp. LM7]